MGSINRKLTYYGEPRGFHKGSKHNVNILKFNLYNIFIGYRIKLTFFEEVILFQCFSYAFEAQGHVFDMIKLI